MATANCNWWQYSRWTYLIGRTVKSKDFSTTEREAVITFIEEILKNRQSLLPRLNLKKGDVSEIEVQNNYALGKMVQLIGRQLKVLPPTEDEKILCDDLFKVTDPRRYMATAFWYDFEVVVGVPEATVGLYQDDSCVAESVSDESGNVAFNVKGGVYTIKVDADGYDQLISENVTVDSNSKFTIESLDPTDYSVTVTVKDSQTAPIEGANVTLGDLPAVQTSSEGIAAIYAEVGDYQLVVSKDGYTSYDESVNVTGANSFDIVLEYAAANFELVFNDSNGSPVNGIEVKIDGKSLYSVIPTSLIDNSNIDLNPDSVMIALSPWVNNEDGTTDNSLHTFSVDFLSCQSTGRYAFEDLYDLMERIDRLPGRIDLSDEDDVLELSELYRELPRVMRAYVSNYGKLSAAVNQIYDLKAEDVTVWDNEKYRLPGTGEGCTVYIVLSLVAVSFAAVIVSVVLKRKSRKISK